MAAMKTIFWLYSVWRARRVYQMRGLLFSQRVRFLDELRPFASTTEQTRIAYPDAIFFIRPVDVDRAIITALSREARKP
jgi:hypothetical protein